MDDDVKELLRNWELGDLIPLFEEQRITLEALSALNTEDLKDLIPQLGPRVLFTRCWRSWKNEYTNNSTFSGLDLSNFQFDLQSIPIDSQNLLKDTLVVVPLEKCPSETQGKENTPILGTDETSPEILVSKSSNLEDLLKQCLEPSSILVYKGSALDGDSSQQKFTNSRTSLASPIPCNINILSNGRKYVTLRCSL